MDPRLRAIVQDVQDEAFQNPVEEGDVDDSTFLIERIMEEGYGNSFNEGDLIEAAIEIGVPEDDVFGFLEQFASYIPK